MFNFNQFNGFPTKTKRKKVWFNLKGCSLSYSLASIVTNLENFTVILVPNLLIAEQIERELKFFLKDHTVLSFPDWETLPYDNFSPHNDIVSTRLATLYKLVNLEFEDKKEQAQHLLIVPVTTLMHKLCPKQYIMQNSIVLNIGNKINIPDFRRNLETYNYYCANQVTQHGEFAVRGSLIDIFPLGSDVPYRIDLFDDEIETIRIFDPNTQLSKGKIDKIRLLPGKEFPFNDKAISLFRTNWRDKFSSDPSNCPIYTDVSQQIPTPGLEYYLPLFFESCEDLFSFFPRETLIINVENMIDSVTNFYKEVNVRFDRYAHDILRPILPVKDIFLSPEDILHKQKQFLQIDLLRADLDVAKVKDLHERFDIENLPDLSLDAKKSDHLYKFKSFIKENKGFKVNEILFCVETLGRKEVLKELLDKNKISVQEVSSWHEFINISMNSSSKHKEKEENKSQDKFYITLSPIDKGVIFLSHKVAIIPESAIFGHKVMQRRRRKVKGIEPDAQIRNLAELEIGDLVVHIDQGIGRYMGLQKLTLSCGYDAEFVTLEYAKGAKLYVPISSLHLISRYSAQDFDNVEVHVLGSDKWSKVKKKALEKVRDVAVELLDIYAKRQAKKGFASKILESEYEAFKSGFPFEETLDQENAINDVISDLTSTRIMDRVVCGDVGFGKTEVALRAAFIIALSGRQVAILVPTTLLAEQHYRTFADRFVDFPINVEVLSRFISQKDQKRIINNIADGKCDIIIGTHKILQNDVKFKNLGLLIIDEEHRFGVRQKDKFKALRAEIDILTLTATPIPRTLNLSMSGIRDLSIITTPPSKRLSVKTFIREYNEILISEAIEREIQRGGQVYYLHNSVQTIQRAYDTIVNIVPNARIAIAHGQMPERELEQVMVDFYHRKNNVLVCTTIIETGIDIPTANTIIIERADKFGLAQLHQLRGRVGRSHHQAYAFCLLPQHGKITRDAKKRLEAISAHDTLGAGFTLSTYDLEIRGAGELLGAEQSGNINSIGISLYIELVEQTVKLLKEGKDPLMDVLLMGKTEIDLQIPNLIPEDYIPDVNTRLVLYKRIANTDDEKTLLDIKVEMIDRFGRLPEQVENLFSITKLRNICEKLNIAKIKFGKTGGTIEFLENPKINIKSVMEKINKYPTTYKLQGTSKIKITKELENSQKRIDFIKFFLKDIAV